ncbi:MAG: hypothetical protein C5B55_02715 [Blastocatellia bacterium]|nr:MAG: hypothetical protein C5B55_02715 [Blastocatellia bacterium]
MTNQLPTQQIPRTQWTSFFDSFSRQHEGWIASLEVFSTDLGAQQEADELPFEGISVDTTNDELQAVVISIGKPPVEHVTHTINQPKRVWLQRTSDGADESLEIEAADNSKILLRFRSPVPPELVDGVVRDR